MIDDAHRTVLAERLREFWQGQGKRKSRTYPDFLVVETMLSTGLRAMIVYLGKREVARRLTLIAAQLVREADAETAKQPPTLTAIN